MTMMEAPPMLADAAPAAVIVPSTFHPSFRQGDIDTVVEILTWLAQSEKTQAWLARLARINPGTLNQVLKGVYTGQPSKFLVQAQQAIKLHQERTGKSGVPFVETSVSRLARAVCHRARLYRNFGVLSGYVGTGKTEALKAIAAAQANTWMVEADPDMTPGTLLSALVTVTRAEVTTRSKFSEGTTAQKFTAVVKALTGTGGLIIVDEAETMQPRALHYLRRIRDKAGIGVVLAGTEYLTGMIRPEHGQFDQIRSRVGFWPATVTGINREDADAIAVATFTEAPLEANVLDALWAYADGSVRVLAEDLIPALRDYGTAKGLPLTSALVKQIATQVLGLKPRRVREGATA